MTTRRSAFGIEAERLLAHSERAQEEQRTVQQLVDEESKTRNRNVNLKNKILRATPLNPKQAIPLVEILRRAGVKRTKPVTRIVTWFCRAGIMTMVGKTKEAAYWRRGGLE